MDKSHLATNKARIIVLAGGRDFGRCPIASRLPTALWPIGNKTVLLRLLRSLAHQGVKEVTVCSNGDATLVAETVGRENSIKVDFLDEPLPAGTAGSIREALAGEKCKHILILPAQIVHPPKIEELLKTHNQQGADLTLFFNPSDESLHQPGQTAGIYVCSPSVLEHIPRQGYFDIKEELIPELVGAGKTVSAAVLSFNCGNFSSRRDYIEAVGCLLNNAIEIEPSLKLYKRNGSAILWKGQAVRIEPDVRFVGPVVVMDRARIRRGSVIFGPTLIGRGTTIGNNCLVENSILWDGSKVNNRCRIKQTLLDYNAVVPDDTVLEAKSVPFELETPLKKLTSTAEYGLHGLWNLLESALQTLSKKTSIDVLSHKGGFGITFATISILMAILWSFWPTFVYLWNIWRRSDEYSSGLLVPFLAVYILWSRRSDLVKCRLKPCLWAISIFILAQGIRLFGLYFMYNSLERLSIILTIASLVLLVFGWQLFKKVATVFLFLCLMLPLPNRVQMALSLPLQRWATSSAVFLLEMIGYDVLRDGNIIHIGNTSVAVAEACNGLRMVTAFFVISGLVVLLVKRSWWEKLIVLASSLPIALLCNTIRLAITAVAFTVLNGEQWEQVAHDFGGYAMMPIALALIVVELWLLTKLTTEPAVEQVMVVKHRRWVKNKSNKSTQGEIK